MSSKEALAYRTAVALLAEGVGRNQALALEAANTAAVALLAEGVGRNNLKFGVGIEAATGRPPRGGRG